MIDAPRGGSSGRADRRRRTGRQAVDLKLLKHTNEVVCFVLVAASARSVHFVESLAPKCDARIEIGVSIDALRAEETEKTDAFQRTDAVATLAQEQFSCLFVTVQASLQVAKMNDKNI
jgi:hypothetical protein